MKRLLCTFAIVISCQILSVAQQDESKSLQHKIGISFSSFGENEVFRFDELDGIGSYDGDGYFCIGLHYLHELNSWLAFESGVEYARLKFVYNSPFLFGNSSGKELSLFNIPVSLRANFWNYFFVNGGLLFDIDLSSSNDIDSQTGIGALMGIGAKYDFDCGFGLFVNPYAKIHSLIPFADTQYHQRVWESGVRLGVNYTIGK